MNYRREMYAANEVITGRDQWIMRLIQPHNLTLTEYVEVFWAEALHGNPVSDDYGPKSQFIDEIQDSICSSMPFIWVFNNLENM